MPPGVPSFLIAYKPVRLLGCALLGCALLGSFGIDASLAGAKPYTPASSAEVLETLPRQLLASRDELAAMRSQLEADGDNPELACLVAARQMQLGGQTGDPRFYGYARAALRPWWETPSPPPRVLQLRAKLKEKNHEYDAALLDLKLLIQQEPQDAQAWIEVANIQRVRGEYRQSQIACDELAKFAEPFAVMIARVPLMAVTGQAEEALALLEKDLPYAEQNYPATLPWIRTLQADLTQALGLNQQAEEHLRAGLAKNPRDYYQLRSYCEFLLDQKRPAEALSLATQPGNENDDGLLLCAAIAAERLGDHPRARQYQTLLDDRFAAIRQRGDQPLGRFEARYALEIQQMPQRALSLALANWRLQKEIHDTATVLEAALAAKNPEQAAPVLAFLKRHHTEHVTLQRLITQLEALP